MTQGPSPGYQLNHSVNNESISNHTYSSAYGSCSQPQLWLCLLFFFVRTPFCIFSCYRNPFTLIVSGLFQSPRGLSCLWILKAHICSTWEPLYNALLLDPYVTFQVHIFCLHNCTISKVTFCLLKSPLPSAVSHSFYFTNSFRFFK